jgi:hypothetical protein
MNNWRGDDDILFTKKAMTFVMLGQQNNRQQKITFQRVAARKASKIGPS